MDLVDDLLGLKFVLLALGQRDRGVVLLGVVHNGADSRSRRDRDDRSGRWVVVHRVEDIGLDTVGDPAPRLIRPAAIHQPASDRHREHRRQEHQ